MFHFSEVFPSQMLPSLRAKNLGINKLQYPNGALLVHDSVFIASLLIDP